MEISDLLKNKRKEMNLTQEELAKSLYVSKRSITNWETGKNTPDIDSLIRLAKLYDISLDDLLLNNSIVVSNIKKQIQLKTMHKYLMCTFVTFLAFFFIISTTGLYGDLAKPVYYSALIGGGSNVFAIIYFLDKINKLENKSESDLIKSTVKWILGGIIMVIISIIMIIMVKY